MSMKHKLGVLGAVGMLAATATPAFAASHREAPMTAIDPGIDNTDLYAFVSPDKPDTVTLIANYTGFQEPSGGPNFYFFDPHVQYSIKVDNDGDAESDVTFNFDFSDLQIANENTFLYNTNTVTGENYKNLNVRQTYSVTMNGEEIGADIKMPPNNVGPRSTPDYETLAQAAITELDNGITVFAGQRDDPFFADVGSIFDLGGLRPFNELHIAPLDAAPGVDALGSFNVNTIAIQVPKRMLTNDGKDVKAADAPNAVIGVYATASRPDTKVFSTEEGVSVEGDMVQLSRLANPLINEVVVPLGAKDQWNRSEPANDEQFAGPGLQPELAALINLLYPATADVKEKGRQDLALILFQGVPGLNSSGEETPIADLLRLNMGIPPSENPSRLGVLAGDLAGFPNGRRLWDDVVDIEIRAIAEGYGEFLAENFDLPNKSPNNQLGDGCDANDVAFLDSFPYVGTPHAGYEHPAHHQTCGGDMPDSSTAPGYRASTASAPAVAATARISVSRFAR